MIINLSILKNVESEKEEIIANYIKESIDSFMKVVRTIDELNEKK